VPRRCGRARAHAWRCGCNGGVMNGEKRTTRVDMVGASG
jgi:hypothetical protein